MCRHMASKLEKNPADLPSALAFRSLELDIMSDELAEYEDPDQVIHAFDRLYIDYLKIKDRFSAARLLLEKCDFYKRRKEWSLAYQTADKIIEQFGESADPNLQKCAVDAYSFQYEHIPQGDESFATICLEYANFLARMKIPLAEALSTVLEMDEAMDGFHNEQSVEMLQQFLALRADLDASSKRRISSRLAANFLFLDQYQESIKILTDLLQSEDDESTIDYMLWLGEAFIGVDNQQAAKIIFAGIVSSLSSDLADDRLVSAQKFLKEIDNAT